MIEKSHLAMENGEINIFRGLIQKGNHDIKASEILIKAGAERPLCWKREATTDHSIANSAWGAS